MAELGSVAGGGGAEVGQEFEVGFVTADGAECRVGASDAWSVPFESCLPVRAFASYKGQRHFVGRWWTATAGALVGYEPWLERDRLILLDFDPDTVGITSQPFWLFWASAQGGVRSHAPDYFARLAGGGAVVVDCRPAGRIGPKDREAFAATAAACGVLRELITAETDASTGTRSRLVRRVTMPGTTGFAAPTGSSRPAPRLTRSALPCSSAIRRLTLSVIAVAPIG